jgi:hypothetical protein
MPNGITKLRKTGMIARIEFWRLADAHIWRKGRWFVTGEFI